MKVNIVGPSEASITRVRAEGHRIWRYHGEATLSLPVSDMPGTWEQHSLSCSHDHTTIDAADRCAQRIARFAEKSPDRAIARWGGIPARDKC